MISLYFGRKEFSCKCGCGFAAVDVELINLLNLVHERFNAIIRINSGCRCSTWNEHVKGKPNSYHTKGMAADIVVVGVDPLVVYNYLDRLMPDKLGIGNYDTFTHLDVRPYKARW